MRVALLYVVVVLLLYCFFFFLICCPVLFFFFFSSRRRHTRCLSDWSSDVCSSDLRTAGLAEAGASESDLAICGEAHTFAAFRAHRARRHLYYCVLDGDPGLARALADRKSVVEGKHVAARQTPISKGETSGSGGDKR